MRGGERGKRESVSPPAILGIYERPHGTLSEYSLNFPVHLSDRAPLNFGHAFGTEHVVESPAVFRKGYDSIPSKGAFLFSHRVHLFVVSHYT